MLSIVVKMIAIEKTGMGRIKQPRIPIERRDKVMKEIKLYFYRQGISRDEAAKRMNIAKASLNGMLCRGYFTKQTVRPWVNTFGFNESFLLTGKGQLVENRIGYQAMTEERDTLAAILEVQKSILPSNNIMTSAERRVHIGDEIRNYFKGHGISGKQAAKMLGYKGNDVLYMAIQAGFHRRSKIDLWAKTFNFNPEFLRTGYGDLIIHKSGYQKVLKENEDLRTEVRRNAETIKQLKSL